MKEGLIAGKQFVLYRDPTYIGSAPNCHVYLFKDPQKCVGMEKVGVGTVDANPAGTTVAANRLSTAEIFLTKPNRRFCRIRWSFVPADRHKYVVSASSTPQGCRAAILDATDPNHIVPEPSSRRRDVGSQVCVPLAQTTTVGDTTSNERNADDSDLPIPSAPAREGAVRTPPVTEDDLSGLMRK